MSKKGVRYYFAYNSPYSFLANTRLQQVLVPFDVEIDYKPVYSPASGGGPDFDSPKMKYLFEDVARYADEYCITLNPGPFANTRLACKGFLFARDRGRDKDFHDQVYEARFLEGKDIGDEDILADIAERAGLDRAEFLRGLAHPDYEAALEASNADAQADEVFGFPFFVFEGKKFWGNDRIDWLVRELNRSRRLERRIGETDE